MEEVSRCELVARRNQMMRVAIGLDQRVRDLREQLEKAVTSRDVALEIVAEVNGWLGRV